MLRTFLDANQIMQSEMVRDLGIDAANVSRLVNDPDANPKRERIDQILTYLSKRLGRPVTYEESFCGTHEPAHANEPVSGYCAE